MLPSLLPAWGLLGPANAWALSPYRDLSPDSKVEVVFADLCDITHVGFKIIDQASEKTVAAPDDDRVSNRVMTVPQS